jgi:hypothetical protein
VHELDTLRAELQHLHAAVGRPGYRQLHRQAEIAGHKLPISTAHDLMKGSRTPRWSTVHAFVIACVEVARRRRPPANLPASLADVSAWRRRFDTAADARRQPDDAGRGGRHRGQAHARRQRPDYWLSFLVAVNTAYGRLDEAAARTADARVGAVSRALRASGLDLERERLLTLTSPAVATAGESLFQCLRAVGDAIRDGATTDAAVYGQAQSRFANALWDFRMVVRDEFGQKPLPAAIKDQLPTLAGSSVDVLLDGASWCPKCGHSF